MPPAEIDVTVDVVHALLRSQLPGLDAPLRRVANGWDNEIFRLGSDLAVRLPRRALGVPLMINEQRWLPVIAPRLPRAVPLPVWAGRPQGCYPWPWSITRWFDGQPLHSVPVRDRLGYAAPLGYFLARLHFPAPLEAPTNPYRGIPLTHRDDLLQSQLAVLDGAQLRAVRRLWPALSDTPGWYGPPLWLHGDPHPGNVIVRADEIVAVIDFGDLTAGDPATDLAIGWLGFEARGRRLLADTYAGAGYLHRDTWARARGWALCLSIALIAHSDDNPAFAAIGWHGLHQVLTGD